jgi:hypothetical protein
MEANADGTVTLTILRYPLIVQLTPDEFSALLAEIRDVMGQ